MTDSHPTELSESECSGDDTTRTDPEEILRRLHESVKRTGSSERYTIVEEIDRGGMGVILRVRDREMRRTLAMKVLRDPDDGAGSSDSSLESQRSARFLEEAQVTGQLDHPGIVPVHELGLDADDRLYFTMRLVKGRTLGEIIDAVHAGEHGWTQTRALGVIQKVCEAMAFAHERKVIHRDLKPANVMVGRFGETYVMDWGLAKILGEQDTRDVRPAEFHTQTILSSTRSAEAVESGRDGDSPLTTMDGDIIGTPAYMAPEQARGRLDEIGPHSDVYSVGALLYHLLTGTAPYVEPGGKTPVLKVLELLMEGPPQPVELLARDVPSELVAICDKAMAREPQRRYASMLAMSEDIQAFIENRVVKAHEAGALAEFKKWVGRNRGLAASLAAAVLVLVAGLAAVSFVQTRARNQLTAKNTELETTNTALDVARSAAVESAELAVASEAEARWQSYAANVVAAGASLDLGAARDAGARLELCDPEHRAWEWHFLRNRVDASLRTIEASPESFVYAVAFSPDGRYVASATGNYGDTGGEDFTLRLWDAGTGALVHELEGHTTSVFSLEFSPSGTELASGGGRSVRVWDVETGDPLALYTGLNTRIAYHPDGLHLAIGLNDGQLLLWNSLDNSVGFRGRVDGGVSSVAISREGARIAAGGMDSSVRVWDIESGRLLREVMFRPELAGRTMTDFWQGAIDLEFGHDGALLVALEEGDVRLIDVDSGELGAPFEGHEAAVTGAIFSPDGKIIVTSSLDATIRFWSRESRDLLEVLQGHDGPVCSIARSPDGDRIVSGSNDRTLRIWDGQPGSSVTTLLGQSTKNLISFQLAFSPDGTKLAWQPQVNSVRVTDTRTGEDLFALPALSAPMRGLAFDRSGEKLLTAGQDDHLRVWNADTGQLLEVVGEPIGPRTLGDFHPDGTQFAAFADTGFITVWDARTGEQLRSWPPPGTATFGMRYSPDGRYLAAGFHTGAILIWNTETFGLEREIILSSRVAFLEWDPTSTRIAAITYDTWDNTVYLFDVETGAGLAELKGHAQPSALAVSPDGTRIATGNWDKTVSLWDVERGEIASLRGHEDILAAVAFSPDGKRIASADLGARHRLWDTTPVRERQGERRAAARRHALERRAQPLVDRLNAELFLTDDVVARLEQDTSLSSELRASAIRLARCRLFSPIPDEDNLQLNPVAQAYGVLLQGDRTPDEYLRALRLVEYTIELVPDAERTPLWSILGLAQFRMGRVDQSLESMLKGWEVEQEQSTSTQRAISPTPVVIAICLARQGRTDEARRLVRERRASVGSVPDASLDYPMSRALRDSTVLLLDEADRILD